MTIVRVAAAVLLRDDGQVLLAQRPEGKPYAGYWEFPGGKLEPGEAPRHALDRELHEELGIDVKRASPWLVQEFVYPHAHVELNFFRVYEWDGELASHDGQAFDWQTPGRYTVAPLLPANTRILAALDLPLVYGITCAEDSDEEAFLARANRALEGGLRLVQVRDKTWPLERRMAFARSLVGARASLRRARALERHRRRSARSIVRRRSLDFGDAQRRVVASARHAGGRVLSHGGRGRTRGRARSRLRGAGTGGTHADASGCNTSGWTEFARLAAATRVPVFALGGLTTGRLARCDRRGCPRRGAAPRRLAIVLTRE